MSTKEAERTVTRTFRIPAKLCDAMQKEAKENRTSLNATLNQLLYDRYFELVPRMKPGSLVINTQLFAEMISRLSDDDVKQLARLSAEEGSKTFILMKHGKITTEGILDLLHDTAMRAGYGMYFEKQDGKLTVTFAHSLGPKESLYISVEMETLFQMIGLHPRITRSDAAVVIEI